MLRSLTSPLSRVWYNRLGALALALCLPVASSFAGGNPEDLAESQAPPKVAPPRAVSPKEAAPKDASPEGVSPKGVPSKILPPEAVPKEAVSPALELRTSSPPEVSQGGASEPESPQGEQAAEANLKPTPEPLESPREAAAPARARQWVGPFSTAEGKLPEAWEPMLFEKIPTHTSYSFVREDGGYVVRADARASASGFTRRLALDLKQFPILRWRWKVEGVLAKGNVAEKSGDDYPARIYVAFKYESDRVGFFRKAKYTAARTILGDLPIGAINYIWASNAPQGGIYDNPFAGDFVKMIAVESGPKRVGEWIVEERDVFADYVRAFGDEPPLVEGVAIMTDTDNTGESVTAWYGDIEFLARAPK